MTQEILSAISTVGFPIVMCLLMYQNNSKTLEKLQSSIDNNTKAIEELAILVKKE